METDKEKSTNFINHLLETNNFEKSKEALLNIVTHLLKTDSFDLCERNMLIACRDDLTGKDTPDLKSIEQDILFTIRARDLKNKICEVKENGDENELRRMYIDTLNAFSSCVVAGNVRKY